MEKEQRVLKALRVVAKIDGEPASDESLFESGLLDSFALPDFVTELEKEFKVSIPDSDLVPRKFDSIGKIVLYLDSRER